MNLDLLKEAAFLLGTIVAVSSGAISSVSDYIMSIPDREKQENLVSKTRTMFFALVLIGVGIFFVWFVIKEDPAGWRLAMPFLPIYILMWLASLLYIYLRPAQRSFETSQSDKFYMAIGNFIGVDNYSSVVCGRILMKVVAILGVLSLSVDFANKALS